MSEIFAHGTFPKRAVHAGAFIVLMSVAVAGFARWTGIGTTHMPPSPVVQSLSLRFFDNPQGGVGVETSSEKVSRNSPPVKVASCVVCCVALRVTDVRKASALSRLFCSCVMPMDAFHSPIRRLAVLWNWMPLVRRMPDFSRSS